jgi:hypothetical protein
LLRSFLRTKINSMSQIIFVLVAVEILAGDATFKGGGGGLEVHMNLT